MIVAALLLATRMGGIVLILPWWGAGAIPPRVKLLTVMVLTMALLPITGDLSPALKNADPIRATLVGISGELLVGLALGLSIRVVLAGVASAGKVLSMQIGLRMANVLDPLGGYQSSVVDAVMQGICILAMLATNLHHVVLRGAAASLRLLPLGVGLSQSTIGNLVFNGGRALFVLIVQVAGPVIAVALAMHVAFAILLRFAPQMNVFFVAFALVILVGIALLAGILPQAIGSAVNAGEGQVEHFMGLLGG